MKTLQEYLIDCLRSTYIYEMSERQKDCEDTVKSECRNILENITLINYFRISELHTTNIGHWKDELDTAIRNAWSYKMKKDNSEGRRRRITNRAFEEKDMHEYNEIYDRVVGKFRKENETMYPSNKQSAEWLDEAIRRTMSQIDTIKELIIKRDHNGLYRFINKL